MGFELALRGQAQAPQELIDHEYRALFGLTYREFLSEPVDVYKINTAIIFLKHKLVRESQKRNERIVRRER